MFKTIMKDAIVIYLINIYTRGSVYKIFKIILNYIFGLWFSKNILLGKYKGKGGKNSLGVL